MCRVTSDNSLEVSSYANDFLTVPVLVKNRTQSYYGVKTGYTTDYVKLFSQVSDAEIEFPRGLYEFSKSRHPQGIVEDCSSNSISPNIDGIDLSKVLQPESGFDLRQDQVLAVRKALINKRGLIQLPTGAGKTEIMSAILKVLLAQYPDMRIIVIEPTDVLVQGTVSRFSRYGLDAVPYNKSRMDFSHSIIVSHPTSLLNDLKKDPCLLEETDAVFWDEVHHVRSDSWQTLNKSMYSAQYSIGLSALAVSVDNLQETDINSLTLDEALILGATGPVFMHVPVKYYTERGILATPVVFQINNPAGRVQRNENDWHVLRRMVIESVARTTLVSRTTEVFVRNRRRVLILVGTKNQAYRIALELSVMHKYFNDTTISFGGNEGYSIDPDKVKSLTPESSVEAFIECLVPNTDVISKFDNKDFSIIIGTSHIDEGVDVKDLDVVILASGGKKDRRIIQRLGRALRKSKTGKYAYIVDFNDTATGVLRRHSALRMKLYKEVIEVPDDHIYQDLNIEYLEKIFTKLEDL